MDKLEEQVLIGWRMAKALAPLGLSRHDIQAAAHDSCSQDMIEAGETLGPTASFYAAKRMAVEFNSLSWAREAGAAAYMENASLLETESVCLAPVVSYREEDNAEPGDISYHTWFVPVTYECACIVESVGCEK